MPGSAEAVRSGVFFGDELSTFSGNLSSERLLYFLDIISGALISVSRGGNIKLSVEMCLIKLCDESLSDDRSALLARIEKLESGAQLVSVPAASTPPPAGAPSAETAPTIDTPVGIDARIDPPPEQSPSSTNIWDEILKLLKKEPQAYAVLSDPAKVSAEIQTDRIIIRVSDPFTINMIENKPISEPLKSAAEKVLKRDVAIFVELGSEVSKTAKQSLESLSAFDIVKFE